MTRPKRNSPNFMSVSIADPFHLEISTLRMDQSPTESEFCFPATNAAMSLREPLKTQLAPPEEIGGADEKLHTC
jgi:hypothetical protein